ncbi:MAG: hemolysin family protein [Candidatus Aureabacteria bacterium]|nr:hemolysin family protein [Candidatus Auribacterota bacterium]
MAIRLSIQVCALAVLIGCSFFFSVSETGLFALNRLAAAQLSRKRPALGGLISALLADPPRLLISIVMGNMLVNIAASALAERVSAGMLSGGPLGNVTWIFSSVVMTFLILILGEILPKTIAINRPERIALRVARPIAVIARVFFPVRIVVSVVCARITGALGRWLPPPDPPLTKAELATAIRQGSSDGMMGGEEREMIAEIFKLGDKAVRQLMTPRTEIISFEVNTPLQEIAKAIRVLRRISPKIKRRRKDYSRIPVYSGRRENVIGILYPKDLIAARAQGRETPDIASCLRPPYFVPESMKASRLLKEFLKRKIHIALVVDEYGGLAGLITFDDLIEEIVGEIRGEGLSPSDFEVMDDNTVHTTGRAELETLNHAFNLKLSSRENVTLGGYLSERLGRIPQPKEVCQEGDLRLQVLTMKGNRVGDVRITKPGIGRRRRAEGRSP